MNKHLLRSVLFILAVFLQAVDASEKPASSGTHDLRFTSLAKSWDEGIPLGNGMIGALIWQRDSVLRMSLDRADLWDLRKIKEFDNPDFRFAWVVEQATKKDTGNSGPAGNDLRRRGLQAGAGNGGCAL